MARDLKIPYLKALQGYLWTRDYEEGALVCPLFPDVEPKLKEWHSAGKTISKLPLRRTYQLTCTLTSFTHPKPAAINIIRSNILVRLCSRPETAIPIYQWHARRSATVDQQLLRYRKRWPQDGEAELCDNCSYVARGVDRPLAVPKR